MNFEYFTAETKISPEDKKYIPALNYINNIQKQSIDWLVQHTIGLWDRDIIE